MSKAIDKPIIIQAIDETTETWSDLYKVHARINKPKADSQYLNAGSTRTKKNLTFTVRYFKGLEDISLNLQGYRVIFNGVPYKLDDYDDYMESHKTVKLLGGSY